MKKFLRRPIFYIAAILIVAGASLLASNAFANGTVYYFNNAVNTSPTELGNFWLDSDGTVPATILPDYNIDQVNVMQSSNFVGDITFNEGAQNFGTVTGNAIFNDTTANNGTVIGQATFNDDSYSDTGYGGGIVTGTAIYNDNTFNFGTVDGDATYNGNSSNVGETTGNATFNDFASNSSTLGGDGIFNDNSQNGGSIAGSAIFNDSSSNAGGTVDGDGTFYNLGINGGTVNGTKTRIFTNSYTLTTNFVADGPWTLVADGVVVNVVGATTNGSTVFSEINGGSFTDVTFSTAVAKGKVVTVTFDKTLNSASIPAAGDFVFTVNGHTNVPTAVAVSGGLLLLTLDTPIIAGDTTTFSYTYGATPIVSTGAEKVATFTGKTVTAQTNTTSISLGNYTMGSSIASGNGTINTSYSILVDTELYVAELENDSVGVIDTITGTLITTIPVGAEPEYMSQVGNKIYVINTGIDTPGVDTVSVIDTVSKTVTATITMPLNSMGAYSYATVVGSKVYIGNYGSGDVYVINSATDTISTTIDVDPTSSGLTEFVTVGKYIYVPHAFLDSVSVIDSTTDTEVNEIAVGVVPYHLVAVGTKVYVLNTTGASVSVIDTTANSGLGAVVATIPTGATGDKIIALGTKVYADAGGLGTKIIDTTANGGLGAVVATVAPHGYMTTMGDKVFIGRFGSTVSAVDYATNAVTSYTMPQQVTNLFPVGNKLYASGNVSPVMYILDTETLSNKIPNLTGFTSTTASGTYATGQTINITAEFGAALAAGSTMTVVLNTGDSVVLSNISGNTLSGSYVVGSGDKSPDLSVQSITSASITDKHGHNRTSYSIPFSQGNFIAENSMIARNIGDSKNIVIGDYLTIPTGANPYQVTATINVGGVDYVYVANQGDDTVSVIRLSDKTIVDTIPTGGEPYGLSTATVSGTVYIYVANLLTDNVTVIDTSDNSVEATINVGVKPYYVATVGTKVYVTNGSSNTVSVINAVTNTVTATIDVGLYPHGIKAHGADLYVANYGDPNYTGGNSISVINSLDNTITATIPLPSGSYGARGVSVNGSKVYISNYLSHNVSVIDTATNTIVDTIAVGNGPRGLTSIGSKMYVENFDEGTISVINTATDTVTETILSGHSPAGIGIVGTDLYISSFQDNSLTILDSTTNLFRGNSTFTFTGPSTGDTNTTSSSFTVTPDAAYTGTITVTPSGGGLSTPVVLTFTNSSSPQTFTITPTSAGTITLTATNNGSLTNPSALTFTASAPVASGGGGGGSWSFIPAPTQAVIPNPVIPQQEVPNQNPEPTVPISDNQPAQVVDIKNTYPTLFAESKNLKTGMTSKSILELQKYLNAHGFTVAKTGPGSPGKETSFFGAATRAAITKFQEAHAKEILTPVGLKKGTGIFGPSTKKYILLHP